MTTSSHKNMTPDWPEPGDFKKSIRREISLLVSGLMLVLMVITGYVITRIHVETVTQNVIDKLLVQARSYSGSAGKLFVSSEEPDALLLGNICRRLAQDNPEVFWAGIADQEDRYLAHTDIKKVIAGDRMKQTAPRQSGTELREGESFGINRDTIFITVPIEEHGLHVGQLQVASSAQPISTARFTSVVSIASITLLILLVGLPVTMVVLRRKLRPVSLITDSLKKVRAEDVSLQIPVRDNNEFGYLAETLRVMGSKLNLAQKQLVEKQRIARELEIAREIQNNILPKGYASDSRFEFFGAYRSAREVGGDYYDFIDVDERHLAFLVADVSGKSLPGMLVMLLTRDVVTRLARTVREPAELLSEVNRELSQSIKKGMFVTMFYGVLDTVTGRFTFASAGHNPLIRVRADGAPTEQIKKRGFPLGLMPPNQFHNRIQTGNLTLNSGDWLIQYTDGINEAQNEDQDEFGMERLVAVLEKGRDLGPQQLVESTLRQHEAFVGTAHQYDDITLLAMKWRGETVDRPGRRRKGAVSVS